MEKASLQENFFYQLIQYTYWFTIINLYFFLFTLPFRLLTFYQLDFENLFFWVILFLAIAPIGPALTGVFSTMGKLQKNAYISPTRDFFRAIKQNLAESLKIWTIQVLIIGILVIDIIFVNGKSLTTILSPILFVLLIATIFTSIYMSALFSRFNMPVKHLIKVSVGLFLFKIKHTFIIMSLITGLLLTIYFIPIISIYYLISPVVFLVFFVLKDLLEEIETEYYKPI